MASNEDRDKKGESKPNNWIWYLVLTSIVVLSVGMFVINNAIYRMRYPDLVRLLEVTRYEEQGSDRLVEMEIPDPVAPEDSDATILADGKISVRATSEPNKRIELSKIRNVRVSDSTVTGEVYKRTVDASGNVSEDSGHTRFRTYIDQSEETAAELRRVLNASNVEWSYSEGQTFLDQYGPVLLMIGAGFLLMMFVARRISGIGSPMSFGRSRGRLYAQEDIGITFDDVAGVDEAVDEVREIVDFLKYPDKYQRLGGRIPKGVLLVGPPVPARRCWPRRSLGGRGTVLQSLRQRLRRNVRRCRSGSSAGYVPASRRQSSLHHLHR
jgi:cell division protease FtsH